MAYEAYVTVEGTKQGKFKGESPRDAHKDKFAALGINYSLQSPRDIATGQASGKRQHSPVEVVKEWGPATPQLFQACATNEVLKSVLFEFIKTDVNGAEIVYHTIKLTNATISKISYFSAGEGGEGGETAKHTSEIDTHEQERISFTFQKIEVENKIGKTSALDDWHK
jgi:type VI secretion system secreted protein Hcp